MAPRSETAGLPMVPITLLERRPPVQRFAVTASREGKLPYPDGSIVAWIVRTYHPLEENGKAFGRPQSFVYTQLPVR